MAEPAAAIAVPSPATRRSGRNTAYHLRRVPVVVWICAAVLLTMILFAVLAPFVAPRDPTDQSLLLRLKPPIWLAEGEPGYILGTDEVGRDILSRMIYGAQISLSVGLLGVVLGSI